MRRLIWTTAFVVTMSGIVLAQAIAEGVLTHGAAASASTGAGKALGGIANQLAGKLGQQTSNAIHPVVTTVKPGVQKRTSQRTRIPQTTIPQTATTASPAVTGSLIASVQGGEPKAPEAKCAPASEPKPSEGTPELSNCGVKSQTAAVDQAAHPSEITLPAAK